MQETDAIRESTPRDGGLQRLPLLRGLLRRVPRPWNSRREFSAGDLSYLANLCHNCRGCYYACQYAPPHEWGINVPPSLAQVRAQSYQEYAWPQPLARAFHRNGVVVSLVTALSLALAIILTALLAAPDELYSPHPSAVSTFYDVIPLWVMQVGGLVTFIFSLLRWAWAPQIFGATPARNNPSPSLPPPAPPTTCSPCATLAAAVTAATTIPSAFP